MSFFHMFQPRRFDFKTLFTVMAFIWHFKCDFYRVSNMYDAWNSTWYLWQPLFLIQIFLGIIYYSRHDEIQLAMYLGIV